MPVLSRLSGQRTESRENFSIKLITLGVHFYNIPQLYTAGWMGVFNLKLVRLIA